ncbi:LOB domain-containing protein 12-like isoform X2 [Phragmites australis]|uniref:LOB domain-containing protein 12-like isoform X2 n=1 Tax=Phragmites australis TaxID=29695 RepID=UPI002D77C8AA|nr:LOB domain-containing protein 12-like isoform X2 [Phragmites australis]
MAGSGSSPCASCKLLRRRCTQECVFAPYFPAEDPHKFGIVHKVFGASNVSKMLQELPARQRADAVSSLVYEANARMRDPVYGCVGAISYLQQQVSQLQMQLALAQADILCVQMHHDGHAQSPAAAPASAKQQLEQQQQMDAEAYGSLLMQNGLMNSTAAHHHHQQQQQSLGSGASTATAMMLQEACLKKEYIWA